MSMEQVDSDQPTAGDGDKEAPVASPPKGDSNEEGAGGPGKQHQLFVAMEEVLDKLKLLNYEQDLIKKSPSYKPIAKHYFAIATNSGEQFFMFTSVAAWLIQKSGKSSFEMPQEHDDPNATVSKILNELRSIGADVDFPPNKLKSGAGEQCVYVLDELANAALKGTHFSWHKAEPVADEDEEAAGADEAELTAEQFDQEEDEPELADDDDDAGFLDLQGLHEVGGGGRLNLDGEVTKEILQSDTDAMAWKLEVERVMPSLKITIRQDAKDWRMHLEQMHAYRGAIGETLNQARPQLDRLSNDIGKSLEKITSREKYLNTQLESLLAQFRGAQDRLAENREKYREASGGVTERSKTLAQIADELDQIKQDMEDRGMNLTDGAPLVKVKQAVTRLEQDLIGMDVQIGVIEQTLLQSQLRDRSYFSQDMYGESNY
uniref:Intraflagellar transport protein 57 homolog n=1 Tax=Plectus sambesii TaxID=2011161 RepID=A0A914W4J4_9BILA